MSKKRLGYKKLQWTCPNCKTTNPGPEKLCLSCGSPQPEDVEFTASSSNELLKNKDEINNAKLGPDIHCAFCGARNKSTNVICTQCGADLSKGKRRKKGQILNYDNKIKNNYVICNTCGAKNNFDNDACEQCGSILLKGEMPDTSQTHLNNLSGNDPQNISSKNSKKVITIIVLLIVCSLISWIIFSLLQTNDIKGIVKEYSWERTVQIEEFMKVDKENWLAEIPSNADIGECELRYHHTQNEPAQNSEEICGTPYAIDQGSGYAEVVQDCEYRVYEQFCDYQIDEWVVVDQYSLSGKNNSPEWPTPQIKNYQQIGNTDESYSIIFQTEKGDITYESDELTDFEVYEIGSEWDLSINRFNAIVDIK